MFTVGATIVLGLLLAIPILAIVIGENRVVNLRLVLKLFDSAAESEQIASFLRHCVGHAQENSENFC